MFAKDAKLIVRTGVFIRQTLPTDRKLELQVRSPHYCWLPRPEIVARASKLEAPIACNSSF